MKIRQALNKSKKDGKLKFNIYVNGGKWKARWLDIYFELISIEHDEFKNKFFTVKELEELAPSSLNVRRCHPKMVK